MPTFNFTTGPTQLPDVGRLSYNGCFFSPLFETKVSSNPVKDAAKRTVKFIEHSISVEGYVTLPEAAGIENIEPVMYTLYRLLTAQGGKLFYTGRALDIVVNGHDVAWGPVPELLEFQPLGAGRSAKVTWRVTVRMKPQAYDNIDGLGIVQLNYETSVSYDEAGFSTLSIKGTLESSMSRTTQEDRSVQDTVDSFRKYLDTRILKGIDLGRFRVRSRAFNISRDKRTMEWDFVAEEKPYMDLPPDCTIARGTYNVRPVKTGVGLAVWLCTLRATYTLRGGKPRNRAYNSFIRLMNLRMQQTLIPVDTDTVPFGDIIKQLNLKTLSKKPLIIDFSMDEGMYLDSRTISFSTTWRLICRFSQIVLASGMWRKVPEGVDGKQAGSRQQKKNLWAQTMTLGGRFGNIMGSKSWLVNQLDPKLDVIIDLGSTEV